MSAAYSDCSKGTQDKRKRYHEDRILIGAAAEVTAFEAIKQPKDATGQPEAVGTWKCKASNKNWRREAKELGGKLSHLTEPAPANDTRSEISAKEDSQRHRHVSQYMTGFAHAQSRCKAFVQICGPRLSF